MVFADHYGNCRIADPEASKPDDWDEDAPKEILDEEAEKPEGWLDDEPEEVDDPGSFALAWTQLCVHPTSIFRSCNSNVKCAAFCFLWSLVG